MEYSVEEIFKLLSEKIPNEKLEDYTFNEYIGAPGIKGCTCINEKWYLYKVDDRANPVFTGPFVGKAAIFAIATDLHESKNFQEYKFTEEEYGIYFRSHFYSIDELGK